MSVDAQHNFSENESLVNLLQDIFPIFLLLITINFQREKFWRHILYTDSVLLVFVFGFGFFVLLKFVEVCDEWRADKIWKQAPVAFAFTDVLQTPLE
jgi:hypothetical protein